MCTIYKIYLAGFMALVSVIFLNLASQTHAQTFTDDPEPYSFAVVLPKHMLAYSRFNNTPKDNPITDHGATLGRVLFHEKSLSKNYSFSCASCHLQNFGFDNDGSMVQGFKGGIVRRSSMQLSHTKYNSRGRYFWDERAATLEQQVLMPIQDPIEMGLSLPLMVTRLKEKPYYTTLFQNAFGSTEITTNKAAKALAQFIRSIESYGSKYDEGRVMVANQIDDFPNYTIEENLGKRLFFTSAANGGAGCVNCHSFEVFSNTGIGPQNNGIEAQSTSNDLGAGEVYTKDPKMIGCFKIPSLRNVAITSPYMHDGRFNTLAGVIEHYNSGIKNHANLSESLKTKNGPLKLNFPEAKKDALIAFLVTLTDSNFKNEAKWSDPFKNANANDLSSGSIAFAMKPIVLATPLKTTLDQNVRDEIMRILKMKVPDGSTLRWRTLQKYLEQLDGQNAKILLAEVQAKTKPLGNYFYERLHPDTIRLRIIPLLDSIINSNR